MTPKRDPPDPLGDPSDGFGVPGETFLGVKLANKARLRRILSPTCLFQCFSLIFARFWFEIVSIFDTIFETELVDNSVRKIVVFKVFGERFFISGARNA